MHVGYQPNFGPTMSLSTLRQVPDSAQCVAFALEGNTEGLKTLFRKGFASPRDVSSTRGYSLLRWALYGQKYKTCKFLLEQGADPYYRPIAASDDCPSDKASDILLRGGISSSVTDILRAMAAGNDFIEAQHFHLIHKVVLGLSLQSLEEVILHETDDIDIPDAMGRTALEWASARGDEYSVTTLLSYGANPNVMDKKLNTPLTLAANQDHTVCVRLLLEAGALPDPVLPPGTKFGTPLNCAARNASDPLVIKTLLDFRANVEATGVDGVTPLLHVARNKGARHAIILLEYGANINATAKDGRTPLTTAITYNNHDILELLLDRWNEYSECPRLKGPHLLDLVTQYGDVRTLQILSSANHLKLRCDNEYVVEGYAQKIRERPGVTQAIIDAFDQLLDTIRMVPSPSPPSHGSGRASHCISRRSTGLGHDHNHEGVVELTDSDGSDAQAWEDAKEKVGPEMREVEFLMSKMNSRKTW